MTLKRALLCCLLLSGRLAVAEPKIAVLGLAEEKSLESVAVQLAVDASNSRSASSFRLKPWFVALTNDAGVNVSLAEKVAADSDVLGVVLHGEAAADPAVIAVLQKAGLATVSASSWAQPRPKQQAFVTWLCPDYEDMAIGAALYARRDAHSSQVAVIDNGAPTAAAAAKDFSTRFKALGGKVVYEGEWQGTDWGLTRTTKSLKANWPQLVFFAGDGDAAGQLVVAMKDEKELKPTDLLGQPTIFEPEFFNIARVKSARSRGVFPCPDFLGTEPLMRLIGIAFPKTSLQYRAYVQVAYKKPGRWSAMLYDATSLVALATHQKPLATPAAAPSAVSGGAQALTDAASDLTPSPTATAEADTAVVGIPSRADVQASLTSISTYKGIRGTVHFSPTREPSDGKSIVYFALNRVNKKEMLWISPSVLRQP
jgi:ABC-type branched-subunit amino acid transport system substrate-binding protein